MYKYTHTMNIYIYIYLYIYMTYETATHCNMLHTLQFTAAYCNTVQHISTQLHLRVKWSISQPMRYRPMTPAHSAQMKMKRMRLTREVLEEIALSSKSCVAVCCSVLQCVAVFIVQCVAVCCMCCSVSDSTVESML